MKFRYLFGPVPSRRLGQSLGVNPIPFKTCNYSCVYCQLGRTSNLTNTRQDFFPPEEIEAEIRRAVELHQGQFDYLTFVGEGEPTLCQSLGRLMEEARRAASVPIAVITNGSLLWQEEVQQDLLGAEVVMPSLDAADPETWRRIDRPHGRLDLEKIIEGMVRFRDRFEGQLWVEVMLVKGLNDQEGVLQSLRQALTRIRPDRVYVNVPIRPPAESWAGPPEPEGMVRAHAILGDAVFIDQAEEGTFSTAGFDDPLEAVAMIVRRHPMRKDQIEATLDRFSSETVAAALDRLVREEELRAIPYQGEIYYATSEGRYSRSDA